MTPRSARAKDRRPGGLMQRYCEQLGSIASRQRVESALKAARVSAELAASSATEAMLSAQASNRAKSEFLANMSHELRTPLNAIMGFSQIIAEETLGPAGTAKYIEYSRDINASAEHLLAIINDILDLARIEAGKGELHEEAVDLQQVIEACVRVVAERAKTADVRIDILSEATAFRLLADERKLKQIVINLLSNAVKFTPPGGTISISWHLFDEARFRLIVRDTGIGIAPENLARVLQPFVQADSGLNRRYEGTGLGLPLTCGLVALHGGTIELQSEVGRGTAAIVDLPFSRVRPVGAADAPAPKASAVSPVHQAIHDLEQSLRSGFPAGDADAAR